MTSGRFPRLHRPGVLRTRDYLPMVPVVLFFSVASQQNLSVSHNLVPWLVVNIASLALTAAVFALARRAVQRKGNHSISLWLLAAIGALLGVTKGVSTGLFGVWAELEPAWVDAVLSRAPQSTVLGILLVVAISIAAHARHVLAEQRRVLVAAALNRQLGSLHHLEQIDAPLIRRALLHTRQALSRSASSQASLKEVAESIVRPLSHELWSSQRNTMPPITLRSIYWRAIGRKSFAPLLTSLIWWVTVLPPLAQRSDIFAAFAISLAIAASYASVLWAVSRSRVQSPWAVMGVIAVGFAAAVFGISAIAHNLMADLSPVHSPWVQVSSWVWALIVTVGVTTVKAVFQRQSDVDERVAKLLTDDDIYPATAQSLEAVVSDRLARFLHGEVVNKLLILANRSSSGGDVESSTEGETTQLLRQLDSGAWLSPRRSSQRSFSERLDELCEAWRGLVEVSYQPADPAFDLDPISEVNLVEALFEAVSNSYRHGLASRVTIVLSSAPSGAVDVTVVDDGIGPRGGPPGLGSSLYAQVSHTRWTLEPHESGQGAVLRFSVPRD